MHSKGKPLVSIGIPTFNRADGYLREALYSACGQTFGDIEIIVSDNCSTDGTEEFMRQLSDSRIHYYRQERALSPNENFNFCLSKASGSYFLLLHDDDIIDEDFVETCLKAANYELHYSIIRTGTRLIDGESNKIREIPNVVKDRSAAGLFHSWFDNQTAFYFCSTLFNTQLLKDTGGFHSKNNYVQDCAAILELAVKAKRVDMREVKASFREYANYIQYGVKLERWVQDFLWLLDRICELIPEDSKALREDGEQFFAALSYKRARVVEPIAKRLMAHLLVMRYFRFRHLPPFLRRITRTVGLRSGLRGSEFLNYYSPQRGQRPQRNTNLSTSSLRSRRPLR